MTQVCDNEKMKKSRSGKKISSRPDVLYKSSRTSNSVVACLAFGENRKTQYPEHFFCHACDLFEDAVRNGNKGAKRTQTHVCLYWRPQSWLRSSSNSTSSVRRPTVSTLARQRLSFTTLSPVQSTGGEHSPFLALPQKSKPQEKHQTHHGHNHSEGWPFKSSRVRLLPGTIASKPRATDSIPQWEISRPTPLHSTRGNWGTNVNWLASPSSGIYIKEVAASCLHKYSNNRADKSIGRTQQNESGAQSHNAHGTRPMARAKRNPPPTPGQPRSNDLFHGIRRAKAPSLKPNSSSELRPTLLPKHHPQQTT